ncbi:MAG: cytochrome d ubiquinol oxidase subunit II, partial [Catenulispora sp.]
MITFWFSLVVLAWVLFFVLEGFDFGVGLLGPLLGRDDHERGAVVRTIGPFWDGNEVWLVAAIGVTFAAFPAWYAALLSGLYLPVAALLLLLAVRGVALEFRGKGDGPRWRRRCDALLAASSAAIVALWGALLAVFVRGLALGPDGSVRGSGLDRSLSPILTWPSLLGAAAALFAALLLGATFLALRTSGPVRPRARDLTRLLGTGGAVALVVAGLGTGCRPVLAAAAVSLAAGMLARQGREATAFALTCAGVAGSIVAVLLAHGSV